MTNPVVIEVGKEGVLVEELGRGNAKDVNRSALRRSVEPLRVHSS